MRLAWDSPAKAAFRFSSVFAIKFHWKIESNKRVIRYTIHLIRFKAKYISCFLLWERMILVNFMEKIKSFNLPKLPYDYNALAPYISEEQLKLHHDKHHQAYVNGANAIFEKIDKAHQENADIDIKAVAKELSFHIGGHMLHTTFWENMAPAGKGGGGQPGGAIADMINMGFEASSILRSNSLWPLPALKVQAGQH